MRLGMFLALITYPEFLAIGILNSVFGEKGSTLSSPRKVSMKAGKVVAGKELFMKSNKHNRGILGFTVLELMVAMGIAMVVLGIAIPNFLSWLPTLRLSAAARQVASDLQVARMKAISQNAAYTVTFNTTDSTYNFTGTSRDVVQEYPGITISSAPANPVFTPRGTASTTGTITLSNGTATKSIVVSTVGRVIIQ